MKRLLMTALAAGMLVAAAPGASTDAPEGYAHEVLLDTSAEETRTASVAGGLPGGVNLTPFLGTAGVDQTCGTDVSDYCEVTYLAVTNPVADTDPDNPNEFDRFRLDINVVADVPGADFDLFVFETNADGTERSTEVASSGNAPGCAQLCGTQADPAYTNLCSGYDECITSELVTFEGAETVYLRVEIVYFASPAGYTADFSVL